MVSLSAWAMSDIGRRRANNEDSYYINEQVGLFLVADGMGGHRGGDRASRLAIEKTAEVFLTLTAQGLSYAQALEQGMNEAALAVYEAGHKEEALWGMGTTLSALAIQNNTASISHIGDTRIYCFRDHKLTQMTRDHSLVNEQVQAGMISEDEARVSPLRNIITRALGQQKIIAADHFSWELHENDLFLLCSDGLTTMVSDTRIANIISNFSAASSVEILTNEANKNGGEDNITIILVAAKAA